MNITDADTIVKVIKDMNLSLKKCCGQCCDGCLTMKGEKNGDAKQIRGRKKSTVLYTYSILPLVILLSRVSL